MLPYFELFGRTIPMYGLCILIGVFAASFVMVRGCMKKGLLWENAVIIGVSGLGIGMIGAKLLYLLTAFRQEGLAEAVHDGQFDALLNGGFVFYGGLLFGIIGAFLGARIAQVKMRSYENTLLLLIPLVHAFGRIGCFCAGCCYGKPTNSIFGIAFYNPISDAPVGVPLIPVQLMEAAMNVILFLILYFIEKKYPNNRLLTPIYLFAYAVQRFALEYLRFDAIRGTFLALSTSQWISAVVFVVAVALVFYRLRFEKERRT